VIDKNLPQPSEANRYCVHCGKKTRLAGKLIHWPSEDCIKDEVQLLNGQMCGTFSLWIYKCAWCRGVDTKRRLREAKHE